MTPAPSLADALARHGCRIHLAIPGDSVFQRAYACSPRGADEYERGRAAVRAFLANVELAAENRARAERNRDSCAARHHAEAALWDGWARFFRDLQNVNQEVRHAA